LLEELVSYVKSSFNIELNAEISMESSPGTLTKSKIDKMKEIGINRISYGIQTLDTELLKNVNREYSINEALNDIQYLLETIGNVNIDTMYGFEGESENTLFETLEKFIEIGVPMISIYALDNQRCDLKKSTAGPAKDEHKKEKILKFKKAKELLYKKGFKNILQNIFIKEDSNASYHHQLRRWDNLPLLSLGIGSQGYAPEKIYQNVFNIENYYKLLDENKLPLEYATVLTPELEMARELTSKIRFTEVHMKIFNNKYNVKIETIFKNLIEGLLKLEFISIENGILKKTSKASYYNNIIPLLFSPDTFKEKLLLLPDEVIKNYPIPYVLTNLGKTECTEINIKK